MAPKTKISVIICTYSERRWDILVSAVETIKNQSEPVTEIIVVVDHNPDLLAKARLALPEVTVIENSGPRGLSGARNDGIAVAQGDVLAFLDDDATAHKDWSHYLKIGYSNPQVMGVGGKIEPIWQKSAPNWFPEEFYWAIGCTYRGSPEKTAPVRNVIGCNMSFRREVFDHIGGFRSGIGRIGVLPVGCEETELCIRARQHWPGNIILFEPKALVFHHIETSRACWTYFISRCYSEGISKALVSKLVGAKDGLSSERAHVLNTLPQGLIRYLKSSLFDADVSGLTRSGAIIVGLATTSMGYMVGLLKGELNRGTDG